MQKLIPLLLILFLTMPIICHAEDMPMLNEKWVLTSSDSTDENAMQMNDKVEIAFLADGTYKLKAAYAKGALPDYLDESGTYVFIPETNEIFVSVVHGGYDYPIKTDEPVKYYGLMFSDYQVYYKIEKRDGSSAQVISCRGLDMNRHKDYALKIWQKEGESCKFTNPQNLELKSEKFIKQPAQE